MNQTDNTKFDFEFPETDDSFTLSEDSEFIFDHSPSHGIIDMDEEIVDLTEPVNLMEYVCPKCANKTEIDLTLVPEGGFVTTCSSCNKQIHIIRESCACRAKRKSFEISCANCGNQLDQHAHCHSCGILFPDYFVTVNPEDARRKARSELLNKQWAFIRSLNFTFKPAFEGSSHDITHAYTPSARTFKTATAAPRLLSRRFALLAIFLFIATVLVATGVYAYNSYNSGQIYADNYIKALYCIKTGADTNIGASSSLKTEWESASASGRSFSPRIVIKDEAKSIKLRSEIDKYMLRMSKPPKKLLQANESLTSIHKIYLDSEVLVASKPRSLQELASSVDSLNKKISLASQGLKSTLPDSLKKELEIAKSKYRGMKDF